MKKIFIIVFSLLFISSCYDYSGEFDGFSTFFLVVFIVIFVIIVAALATSGPSKKDIKMVEDWKEKERIAENKYIETKNQFMSKYGELTKEIMCNCSEWMESEEYLAKKFQILFFEESKTVVINNSPLRFEDIISCELKDNETIIGQSSVTKTSTGSILGRAVVGGILGGGIGAVIGGLTAKQNTVSDEGMVEHNFIVNLIVNRIDSPSISLCFYENEDNAREAYSVFCVLIERNKYST